jgi:NAD(P)-dependent dehydrogenase (short-subunit alcohol dehydrogenase family)
MTITIISGASRGIGRAIADNLSDTGHALILLNSAVVDFENYDDVYVHCRKELFDCWEYNGGEAEQINIILCASQIGTFNTIDLKEADRLYKINILGNMAVIEAVMEHYVKLRIVWFAGGGAAFAYPEFFAYSLSKVAVVRAVENLSTILQVFSDDVSIIALAPGAVETDMLKTVIDADVPIRTKTDISEPVVFVRKFIMDEINSKDYNGCFLHVRDDLNIVAKDMFKLRRTE